MLQPRMPLFTLFIAYGDFVGVTGKIVHDHKR